MKVKLNELIEIITSELKDYVDKRIDQKLEEYFNKLNENKINSVDKTQILREKIRKSLNVDNNLHTKILKNNSTIKAEEIIANIQGNKEDEITMLENADYSDFLKRME